MEEKKELTGETKEAWELVEVHGYLFHTHRGARLPDGVSPLNVACACGAKVGQVCSPKERPGDRGLESMGPRPFPTAAERAEEHAALLAQLRTTTLALELVLAQPPSSDFEWAAIRATVQTAKNLIAKVEG